MPGKRETWARLLRYGVVGGLTTAVNWGLFTLLYTAWQMNENLSNAISVVCAVCFAYLANKHFVFRTRCADRRALAREALSFFSARAATMLFELGGVFVFVTLIGWTDQAFWVKGAVNVVVILLNYILSQRLVFQKQAHPTDHNGPDHR
ncbi:MAG: GtrA family protein [Oscillospiraceae bacterium]|jgi:putative flippase GtrA|nr:GtrA family protein [Oscillospiraceae bacterium]